MRGPGLVDEAGSGGEETVQVARGLVLMERSLLPEGRWVKSITVGIHHFAPD